MKRNWENYIQKNKYSECMLISTLNAYYYFTGKCIKQDSKKYENFVDLCKGRHGSAFHIEKVRKKLGLKVLWEGISLLDLPKKMFHKKIPLPMEFCVWEKHYGFHSTLIVDHETKTDAYRIANFKWQTTLSGWIFVEDAAHFRSNVSSIKPYRLFGLK